MSLANNPLAFKCGKTMKNCFMLAPMTNTQSLYDGRLSEAEYNWLMMRAKGGFGMVMTCAAHVQPNGQGFPGQLGIYSDLHYEGLKRLARGIKAEGSLAMVQLYHGGMRSPAELIGETPVSASDQEKPLARAMNLSEIKELRDNFIRAAVRAKTAGFDGVEVHGAHGYILCQFLSAKINQRTDDYGGSLENRSRLLLEIIDGIRNVCGPEFLLGVRLSPERFGMKLSEIKDLCRELTEKRNIDFLDISLWDCFKLPEEEAERSRSLLEHFTAIDFKDVKLTVAGKIRSASDVNKLLRSGVDFVSIGRAAILHHDFPKKVIADPGFTPTSTPVSREYLYEQGLSDPFIEYMNRWPDFVEK